MAGGCVVCSLTGGVDVNGVADSDNTAELLRQTGLEESSLLYARWSGEVRRPACFVAVCAAERWVVLGIRGTLNLNDCFTDVDAAEVAWHSLQLSFPAPKPCTPCPPNPLCSLIPLWCFRRSMLPHPQALRGL